MVAEASAAVVEASRGGGEAFAAERRPVLHDIAKFEKEEDKALALHNLAGIHTEWGMHEEAVELRPTPDALHAELVVVNGGAQLAAGAAPHVPDVAPPRRVEEAHRRKHHAVLLCRAAPPSLGRHVVDQHAFEALLLRLAVEEAPFARAAHVGPLLQERGAARGLPPRAAT